MIACEFPRLAARRMRHACGVEERISVLQIMRRYKPLATYPMAIRNAESIRRLVRRCGTVFSWYLCLEVLMVLYLGLSPPFPAVFTRIPFFMFFGIFIPIAIGSQWALRTYARRVRQRTLDRLAESAYRICLNCDHDLRGVPERHTCPECGVSFDVAGLRETWEKWLASWPPRPRLDGLLPAE